MQPSLEDSPYLRLKELQDAISAKSAKLRYQENYRVLFRLKSYISAEISEIEDPRSLSSAVESISTEIENHSSQYLISRNS